MARRGTRAVMDRLTRPRKTKRTKKNRKERRLGKQQAYAAAHDAAGR